METLPPVPPPSPRREWWERKARWVLPIGCLGLALIIGAAGIGGAALIYGAIRSSDPYKLALAAANADERVVSVLGSPVTDRLLVTGTFNTSGLSGRAEFALPVKGPKGNATIFAMAAKSMGAWNLEVLVLEVAGTRERIDLLHEPDSAQPSPTATPTNHAMLPPVTGHSIVAGVN